MLFSGVRWEAKLVLFVFILAWLVLSGTDIWNLVSTLNFLSRDKSHKSLSLTEELGFKYVHPVKKDSHVSVHETWEREVSSKVRSSLIGDAPTAGSFHAEVVPDVLEQEDDKRSASVARPPPPPAWGKLLSSNFLGQNNKQIRLKKRKNGDLEWNVHIKHPRPFP
eukprot:CAMPEP_0177615564 /NCGR_PEP_ID=MMETSP0419_2-20121207/23532_1 /TAXON_ID=582737 /ORGANISM="Tetraselmis sp., Strain GSL018" /LENGTH=164 /DNA_ID=CAMNT_0019113249 /DNA_START=31 /DNA_END=521 /DNA_ORIENTATION=-